MSEHDAELGVQVQSPVPSVPGAVPPSAPAAQPLQAKEAVSSGGDPAASAKVNTTAAAGLPAASPDVGRPLNRPTPEEYKKQLKEQLEKLDAKISSVQKKMEENLEVRLRLYNDKTNDINLKIKSVEEAYPEGETRTNKIFSLKLEKQKKGAELNKNLKALEKTLRVAKDQYAKFAEEYKNRS